MAAPPAGAFCTGAEGTGLRDTESRSNTEQGDKSECQGNPGLLRDLVYLLPLQLESRSASTHPGRPPLGSS